MINELCELIHKESLRTFFVPCVSLSFLLFTFWWLNLQNYRLVLLLNDGFNC